MTTTPRPGTFPANIDAATIAQLLTAKTALTDWEYREQFGWHARADTAGWYEATVYILGPAETLWRWGVFDQEGALMGAGVNEVGSDARDDASTEIQRLVMDLVGAPEICHSDAFDDLCIAVGGFELGPEEARDLAEALKSTEEQHPWFAALTAALTEYEEKEMNRP